MDFRFGHVNHFDVLCPQGKQLEHVFQSALHYLQFLRGILSVQLLTLKKLGILLFKKLQSLLTSFASGGTTELTDKQIAIINIILDNFEFVSVRHVLNGTLDISEYGLEEQVLLLHDFFFV
jgi:hypothetical protein